MVGSKNKTKSRHINFDVGQLSNGYMKVKEHLTMRPPFLF